MRKSVGQAPTAEQANKRKKKKCQTGSYSAAGEQTQKKKCQTSPDIGAERENHNVGRGPT